MPSVLENTATDYLPAEGFTHGGGASLKKVAKLALASAGDDQDALLEKLPPIQHYTNNKLLGCKYVSPVLETNLKGCCPIMLVSLTNDSYFLCHVWPSMFCLSIASQGCQF